MFQLTGNFILIASTILAIALPILAAVLWSRKPPASGGRPVAVLKFLGRIGLILVAQVTAMAALFFYVNDQYGFYASWSDLLGLGHDTPARIVQVNELHPGTGKLEVLNVHAKSGVSADTLVWLPPGYDASGSTRYPVVMFLPGQPSHPQNLFNEYDFGDVASQAIAAGTVRPFVGCSRRS